MQRREKTKMAETGRAVTPGEKNAMTEVDFLRLAGISPELAEFVTAFVERPEILFSMPFEKRQEIEAQMDTVLIGLERPSTF